MAEQTRTGVVRLIDIRDRELSTDEVLQAVADDAAGASAVFVGTVRSDDEGRPVVSLSYEAHHDAVALMAGVVEQVAANHQVIAVAAVHRIGLLEVGDVAVVAAASAAHRAEAFDACRAVIDEVKARVPIWKRQTFSDGQVEWPGIEGSLIHIAEHFGRRMKVLLWLMIPVAALIVGIIWAYVISRPAKPAAMQDSMESFSRFRHALASDPASRSARRAQHSCTRSRASTANRSTTHVRPTLRCRPTGSIAPNKIRPFAEVVVHRLAQDGVTRMPINATSPSTAGSAANADPPSE